MWSVLIHKYLHSQTILKGVQIEYFHNNHVPNKGESRKPDLSKKPYGFSVKSNTALNVGTVYRKLFIICSCLKYLGVGLQNLDPVYYRLNITFDWTDWLKCFVPVIMHVDFLTH